MKHEEGYREPTDREIEFDIPAGMEFELSTMRGWIVGTYPEVLDKNTQLDEFGDDYGMKLAHAVIRVKINPPA